MNNHNNVKNKVQKELKGFGVSRRSTREKLSLQEVMVETSRNNLNIRLQRRGFVLIVAGFRLSSSSRTSGRIDDSNFVITHIGFASAVFDFGLRDGLVGLSGGLISDGRFVASVKTGGTSMGHILQSSGALDDKARHVLQSEARDLLEDAVTVQLGSFDVCVQALLILHQ